MAREGLPGRAGPQHRLVEELPNEERRAHHHRFAGDMPVAHSSRSGDLLSVHPDGDRLDRARIGRNGPDGNGGDSVFAKEPETPCQPAHILFGVSPGRCRELDVAPPALDAVLDLNGLGGDRSTPDLGAGLDPRTDGDSAPGDCEHDDSWKKRAKTHGIRFGAARDRS